MANDQNEVTLPASEARPCDFCKEGGMLEELPIAEYDFKTIYGSWANGCLLHYKKYRYFRELGTGRGHKLIFKDSSDGTA